MDFVLLLSTAIRYTITLNRFQADHEIICSRKRRQIFLLVGTILRAYKFTRSESHDINSKLRNVRLTQQL
jgi:hypothetical protein